MICEKCGAQNREGAAFCGKCGARLGAKPAVPKTLNNTYTRTQTTVQRRSPKSRRLLLTTKKTNGAYLIPNLISDILLGGGFSGFLLYRSAELMSSYRYRSEGEALQKVGLFLFIFSMLSCLYHIMVSRTHTDFFENRISGMGMQGIQCKSFDLRFDQLSGISISKGFLNIESGGGVFLVINTPAGNYKVITKEARAQEIVEFYSNMVN